MMTDINSGRAASHGFARRHRAPIAGAAALTTAACAWFVWPSNQAEASGSEVYIVASFSGAESSSPSGHPASQSVATANGFTSDWAGDWEAGAGTAITPDLQGPYGTTLVVRSVFPVCSGGAGGTGVTVEVREPNGGAAIGAVSYLHLDNVGVTAGQTVYTDTTLGVVGGSYAVDSSCWTGPHIHIEGYNYAESDQSCYYDTSASPGTRLGRIGGSDVPTGGPQACPA